MNSTYLHSDKARMPTTPELQSFIAELIAGTASPATATLIDLRHLLLGNDLFLSEDGEVLSRLDRTSLVIEVDDLIDGRGNEAPLVRLLATWQEAAT